MKKVVHIITGLNEGGAEGVLKRLCLSAVDFDHVVISLMDSGKYGGELKDNGVDLYCLNLKRGKLRRNKFYELIRILKHEDPDVVQTWMYHADLIGGVAAKLAGCRNIFWGVRHSVLEFRKTKITTLVTAGLCAVLSRSIPKKIICCARRSVKSHASIGYKKNKMVVVYNGFDLKKFSPDIHSRKTVRLNLQINKEDFFIGMVGRFDPYKDHSNLFKSLVILKDLGLDVKCALVGKGMCSDNYNLKKIIAHFRLEKNLLLLGPKDNVPEIMNALDLHVLSSSSEAFPNVLAEAMACGTPCVTTNVGDAAEIVKSTGVVCQPKDSVALSDAIFSMYLEWRDRNKEWSDRKTKCVERVNECFSIDEMLLGYEKHWLSE